MFFPISSCLSSINMDHFSSSNNLRLPCLLVKQKASLVAAVRGRLCVGTTKFQRSSVATASWVHYFPVWSGKWPWWASRIYICVCVVYWFKSICVCLFIFLIIFMFVNVIYLSIYRPCGINRWNHGLTMWNLVAISLPNGPGTIPNAGPRWKCGP